jgi:hypothetical protein
MGELNGRLFRCNDPQFFAFSPGVHLCICVCMHIHSFSSRQCFVAAVHMHTGICTNYSYIHNTYVPVWIYVYICMYLGSYSRICICIYKTNDYEYERMTYRTDVFFTVPKVPRRRIMRNIMFSLDSCKNPCIDCMGNP